MTKKTQPRRILMTADTVSGVWTYALELARALGKYDIEVAIATMGPEPLPAQREEAVAIPNVNLFTSKYKLEWMQNPWGDVKAAGDWLLSLEKRLRPDVVHLNGYAHAALPWKSPKLVVGHSCLFSRWHACRFGEPPSEWNAYKSAVERGLNAADLVVAPTRAMLKSLNENYADCINEKGVVIPNGLDVNSLNPTLKQKFVFSAGHLSDEAKNIKTLAAVAWELPWAVCIAGEKQSVNSGDTASTKENCYRLGTLPRETLRYWYACASIYVLPARYEPFGLTVLEAALSGCALVLGGIDSLRENWAKAAIFVNPADRVALKETLCELMRNEVYRKRLGEVARARAVQFTSTRMADRYADAYSNLLTRRTSREVAACA